MDVIKSEPHTIITDIKEMIENNTQKEIALLHSFSTFLKPWFYRVKMNYCQDDKTIQGNLAYLSIGKHGIHESNTPIITTLTPLTHIKPNKLLKMVYENVLFWEGDNIYEAYKKAEDIHRKIVMNFREKFDFNVCFHKNDFELIDFIWRTLFYILYYSSYTPLDAVWNQLKLLLPTTLKYIDFNDKHWYQFTQDDIHDILTLNDDARLDLLMNHLNINFINPHCGRN